MLGLKGILEKVIVLFHNAAARFGRARVIRWLFVVVALVVIVFIFLVAAEYKEWHPSTDDAYVGTNIAHIAPQVGGAVLELPIKNNQQVHKGDLLFKIDPQPFQLAVDHAAALLDTAQQSSDVAKAKLGSAEALIQQRQAQLDNAKLQEDRAERLVKEGSISRADADNAASAFKVAVSAVAEAQSEKEQALQEIEAQAANIRAAQSQLKQAQLDLSYTVITAPADGQIINLTMRPQDVLPKGEPQFALLENNLWWVDANFKETDLQRVRHCQLADVILDMYPDHVFPGSVQSISGGTGAAFSLLPPENATGNWIKVTQRIPVRIKIQDDPHFPLRVGATSTVTISATSAGCNK